MQAMPQLSRPTTFIITADHGGAAAGGVEGSRCPTERLRERLIAVSGLIRLRSASARTLACHAGADCGHRCGADGQGLSEGCSSGCAGDRRSVERPRGHEAHQCAAGRAPRLPAPTARTRQRRARDPRDAIRGDCELERYLRCAVTAEGWCERRRGRGADRVRAERARDGAGRRARSQFSARYLRWSALVLKFIDHEPTMLWCRQSRRSFTSR